MKPRFRKRILQGLAIVFAGINAIAFVGVYAFTHHKLPGQIGLGVPRPMNAKRPSDMGLNYTTQRIPIHKTEWLEAWWVPTQTVAPKGTVLLFPGSGGSKGTQLLAPAKAFNAMHYNVLLVDFRGVGGSSGNTKTLGVREAQDVAATVQYAQRRQLTSPIILYGVSMGSAAILRAIAAEQVNPDAIILELLFVTLVNAVKSRLQAFNLPSFPAAELLVLWGSLQYGFNGFAHNPGTYANQIRCPALVLQGQQDQWTAIAEVEGLVQNLRGPKQLVVFPKAGHHLLVTVDKQRWLQSTESFLDGL